MEKALTGRKINIEIKDWGTKEVVSGTTILEILEGLHQK